MLGCGFVRRTSSEAEAPKRGVVDFLTNIEN